MVGFNDILDIGKEEEVKMLLQELLQEKQRGVYHNRGGKERARKYYQENKEEIKKKEILKYLFMHESDQNVIRQRSLDRYYKTKSK